MLGEVSEFAELARCGAYLAGDRRVSPRERSRWRLTFRRLAADAQRALRAEDPAPAEAALAQLIDLACETRGSDYFRSEDPMEAARFVVSDAAALLWESLLHRYGFADVRAARGAAAHPVGIPVRLDAQRVGSAEQQGNRAGRRACPDATDHDMWVTFADRYLDALDEVARAEAAEPKSRQPREYPGPDDVRRRRTAILRNGTSAA